MKKEISEHAAAAKAIRAICKELGLNAKVKSSIYSMGSSVHVNLVNPDPKVMQELESRIGQFQYGHFDGMTDMYEYSNSNENIPQVKFVSASANYSNEIKQSAWDFIRANFGGAEDAPEEYKNSYQWSWSNGWDGYQMTNRVITSDEWNFTFTPN